MTKYDFEDWLRHRLSDLPPEELDRIAAFYMDAIEARMEDGMTEEQAIYDLGEPEALLEAIRESLPEYGQTVYQPVRQSRQAARRGRRLAAVVTAAATGLIVMMAFGLIINFSRPTTHIVAVPEAIAQEDVPIIESAPMAICEIDASTLEKVTVAASLAGIQVEPAPGGHVCIMGDPAFYNAVRRGETLYLENVEQDVVLQIPDHLKLEIKCDLGDVVLYEIVPVSLQIYCDAGNITLYNVSAQKTITLETDVGSIEGTLRGSETDYEIDSETDLGQSNLSDSHHSGDEEIKLTVTTAVGDIDLTFEE